MATYKSKAVVDIDVQGLNSIEELEEYINQVNDELKTMDVNSKAFKDLANKSAGAADKLKSVETRLEGVASQDKADGIMKLGEGFAGALAGAQGLSMALGENNEELEKTLQKVGGLVLALDGMRKVTEAISAENIKKLRGVGRSFQGLLRTVRATSTGMKAALASTGIGLLVIAVGLLIANWDKLTKLISNNQTLKNLNKQVDALQKQVDFSEKRLGVLNEIIDTEDKLSKLEDRGDDNYKLQLEKLQKQLDLIQQKNDLQKKTLEKDELEEKEQKRKIGNFKNIVLLMFGINKGLINSVKKWTDANQQVELTNLGAQKIAEQIKLINKEIEIAQKKLENQPALDTIKDMEQAYQNQLTILGSLKYTSQQIYNLNVASLDQKIKEIEINKKIYGQLTREEKRQISALEAQKIALKNNNDERRKMLEETINGSIADQIDKQLQKDLNLFDDLYNANLKNTDELNRGYESEKVHLDEKLAAKQREADLNEYIAQQQYELIPFDKKGLEILKEQLGLVSDKVKLGGELEGIDVNIDKLSKKQQIYYYAQNKALNDVYKVKTDVLKTENNTLDNLNAQYKKQLDILDADKKSIKDAQDELYKEIQRVQLQELSTTNLEKKAALQTELNNLNAKYDDYSNQIYNTETEIYNVKTQQQDVLLRQKQIANEQKDLDDEKLNKQKQIKYEIEQQERLSMKMKNFVQEYNDVITSSQGLIDKSFEMIATFYDNRIKKMQSDMDEISGKFDDLHNKELEYENLLKDADGERYQEILDNLNKVKQQEASLDKQRKDADNKRADAEHKAAVWRKSQAIIDATIQGALAVIEALPNVILAAIVGAASGAEIATIAAQPIPPKPKELYVGGYTGQGDKYEPAGVIYHKHEYIVPSEILDSDQGSALVSVLENMRTSMKGFADGGYNLPNTNIKQPNVNLIDYDKLAQAMANYHPVVSVKEITSKQSEVSVLEDNASI